MKIVVCIKEILDTGDARFDADTGRLQRQGQPVTINALDEYAVEEALRLKEAHGGTVTVLTMGTKTAATPLKHAVAMGADAAIHISDDALVGSDALGTARVLSRAIAGLDGDAPDLILCGAETLDGNTGFVGPAVAQLLGIPHVAFVEKIEQIDSEKAVVHRMMEEGHDRIEIPLPALLSVVKAINEPRITSLKGKMRAKKCKPLDLAIADIAGLDPSTVGAAGATTRVLRAFSPEARPKGVKLEGEPAEMAQALYEYLK